MTLAGPAPTPTHPTVSQTVPIVILGTDALLAALPATPVQLAHACLRAGFSNVIPASWGDELIAAAVLRRLPQLGTGPVIQCSCPFVAHRLLTVGGDLRPVMLPLVPPPIALARYVRALSHSTHLRITYVGACPGAVDESIDIRMMPESLIAMLAERRIMIDDQPRVFESIIPPDRRRYRSQPGGAPSADTLWNELGARSILEIEGDDFVAEIAQHILGGKNVLIDASTRLGCVCSGAVHGRSVKDARPQVVAFEPPRSTTPVVEEQAPIDLELHVPAAPRTPVDVVAVPPTQSPPTSAPAQTYAPIAVARGAATGVVSTATPPGGEMPFGHRISPVRGYSPLPEARPPRPNLPLNPRPVLGTAPVARDVEGKALPRAYVARRRSSPKGMSAIPMPTEESQHQAGRARSPVLRADHIAQPPGPSSPDHDPLAAWPVAPRQLLYIAIAVTMLAISVSTIVGVIVGRALK